MLYIRLNIFYILIKNMKLKKKSWWKVKYLFIRNKKLFWNVNILLQSKAFINTLKLVLLGFHLEQAFSKFKRWW